MKKIILFVFALVAMVIAEDDEITRLAAKFECDIETIQACMMDAQINIDEIRNVIQKWKMMHTNLDENMDEDGKQSLMKYHLFIACMLEKKEMMKDSKIIVEKIIEAMEKEISKYGTPVSIDAVKECIIALNENEALSREERAMGVMVCFAKNGVPVEENV